MLSSVLAAGRNSSSISFPNELILAIMQCITMLRTFFWKYDLLERTIQLDFVKGPYSFIAVYIENISAKV